LIAQIEFDAAMDSRRRALRPSNQAISAAYRPFSACLR